MNETALQPVLQTSEPFQAFLGDIEALGIIPGGARTTEFAVIAARSNERFWLIPMRPRHAALAGFALFHPVTWRANVVKKAATLAARAGLSKVWARKRIALDLSSLSADYFDRPTAHLAFFTGTDGPHRKTAIEFIDTQGGILGYAKVTRRRQIASYLQTEAAVLRQLEILSLKSADVPKCVAFGDTATHAMLVTDSRKSRRSVSPRKMTAAHIRFLLEIADKTRHDTDDAVRKTLAARLRRASAGSSKAWRARFDSGLKLLANAELPLRVALAHGDFTPWNCFLDGGRLYVFDWEYSDPAIPLGYDVMKFRTCQQGDTPAEVLVDRIVEQIAGMYLDGHTSQAREHCHLALLLHSAFYITRVHTQKSGTALWHEEAQFAALIDTQERRRVSPGAPRQ